MKLFLEVFPDLKLDEELADVFASASCKKVTACNSRQLLRVHIENSFPIPYRHILRVEKEIKRQMFSGSVDIMIDPHYLLSEQYTSSMIFEMCKDSFMQELEQESGVLGSILSTIDIHFPENEKMALSIPANPILRQKAEWLKEFFTSIFAARFDRTIEVEIISSEENKQRESAVKDALLAEKEAVARIMDDYDKLKKQEEAQKETEQERLQKEEEKKQNSKKYRKKLPADANLVYGRNYENGEFMPLSEINDEIGEVIVRGMITAADTRSIKNEKTIYTFTITDFTDSIRAKIFVKNVDLPAVLEAVSEGTFIQMKAVAVYDTYEKDIMLSSVIGIKKYEDFREKRMDYSPRKRVELHCHTNMSDMDGISSTSDIIKRAKAWRHKAIAITDHGCVHAFTEASKAAGKDIKVIYGCEGYLVDDTANIVSDSRGQSLDGSFVVFDIETTGFSASGDKIIEIGAVKVSGGVITERFSEFVNPGIPIPPEIVKLTGITDLMVEEAEKIETVLPAFLAFCEGCSLVAHNAQFDTGFIRENCRRLGFPYDFTSLDTMTMARSFLGNLKNYKLDTVVAEMGCTLQHHHRAVDDAGATADVFVKFLEIFRKKGIRNVDELNEYSHISADAAKKMRAFHIILLAKNEIGRINLYRLVSESNINYFYQRPKIPKSLLMKYREGLILGSACEAGELFRAVEEGRSSEEIARIVEFYDYLEIQPVGNNEFLIRDEKRKAQTVDDLRDLNRRIVALGRQFDKPVCATCDVHFLDPEDEIYRRIIMYNKNFDDADRQPPLYLHTTEEMLEEFSYLGEETAEEIVITNPNLIADMIEYIKPVRPDKCPPVIENSDKILREICYNRAHEIYGPDLPQIVTDRMERELTSIITNGFAVMYIIAQKLVWKSVADGYLVGSRGSVGSSMVAYLAGITEVNSLQAHYRCPSCYYVDFDSDYVKSFSGRSGCDMENKICPVCGKPLIKDGHDIPFETFLGFKGDKEPDIDLNYSGDYQSKAHAYTEVIFGEGKTFRAGTAGTLADKTAYGYVAHYYEEHEQHKRSCEIARIAQGCMGVKRNTGQHPGGIIVLPHNEEIYSFTPIQHPPKDETIVTTQFDYHSIEHNLLKLDILGHDDPTMIRMLEDLTGVDATTLPLDAPESLSLFRNLDSLGLKPEDLGGTDLGTRGIPEFGTEFAMQMLRDTKPTQFSDLVRIAGLAHGTDVWLGNAQTLIQEGKAVISTAICTRDDIMIYLIQKGIDHEKSFKIMESVRKGKGLTPDWESLMIEHNVPDWYIWSCKKIKYMFPKAHAVAYVMMGMRIAWFKIHIPLAFYAAFFTVRATAFNYAMMCSGKPKVDLLVKELQARIDDSKKNRSGKPVPQKDKDTLRDLKIVQEFYARGYDFMKIDLYESDARRFQIIDDKRLLPPFTSIDGMGETAAESLAVAAKDGPFISRDDIRQRGKVSQTVIASLADLGVLGDLPESNQLTIFDIDY